MPDYLEGYNERTEPGMFQLLTPGAMNVGPMLDSDMFGFTIINYADAFEQLFRVEKFSNVDYQVMELAIQDAVGVLATGCDNDHHPSAELYGDKGGRVVFIETHKNEIKAKLSREAMLAEAAFLFQSAGSKIKEDDPHLVGFGFFTGKGKSKKGNPPTDAELIQRLGFLRVMFRSHKIPRELAVTKLSVVRIFAKLKFLASTEAGEDSATSKDDGTLGRMGREFIQVAAEAEAAFAPWRAFHRTTGMLTELRSGALVEKLKLCASLYSEI